MRPRLLAIITVTALALAACGSTSGTGSPATAAAAPASTASTPAVTTPAVLTLAQAATRYVQIVTPFNTADAARVTAEKRYAGVPTATRVTAAYRALALTEQKALRTFMANMLATRWPADVAVTAQKVVDESAPLVTTLGSLAKARTVQDIDDAWNLDASSNAAAQRIRVQLGLPAAG